MANRGRNMWSQFVSIHKDDLVLFINVIAMKIGFRYFLFREKPCLNIIKRVSQLSGYKIVCFHGRPRQATGVLQPAGLLYRGYKIKYNFNI
jgi:hypothetical protein